MPHRRRRPRPPLHCSPVPPAVMLTTIGNHTYAKPTNIAIQTLACRIRFKRELRVYFKCRESQPGVGCVGMGRRAPSSPPADESVRRRETLSSPPSRRNECSRSLRMRFTLSFCADMSDRSWSSSLLWTLITWRSLRCSSSACSVTADISCVANLVASSTVSIGDPVRRRAVFNSFSTSPSTPVPLDASLSTCGCETCAASSLIHPTNDTGSSQHDGATTYTDVTT